MIPKTFHAQKYDIYVFKRLAERLIMKVKHFAVTNPQSPTSRDLKTGIFKPWQLFVTLLKSRRDVTDVTHVNVIGVTFEDVT